MALLPRAKHVLSIERDPDLPAVLDETCDDFDNFTLIGKDALRLNDDRFDLRIWQAGSRG